MSLKIEAFYVTVLSEYVHPNVLKNMFVMLLS